MPRILTISTTLGAQGSFVISQVNPTPIPKAQSFVLGNQIETNLYFADGLGDYEAFSGAADSSVCVSIGRAGLSLWSNTNWTTITNGWTGLIETDAQTIGDLFTSEGVNPLDLYLEVTVTDATGNEITHAQIPIQIFNRVTTDSALASPVSPSDRFGVYALANGIDTDSVENLALSATPRMVLLTVAKPAGGLNIFACVVSGSITADGFDFTLSGLTDATTYKLYYHLIF